jgi:hypothetical protein
VTPCACVRKDEIEWFKMSDTVWVRGRGVWVVYSDKFARPEVCERRFTGYSTGAKHRDNDGDIRLCVLSVDVVLQKEPVPMNEALKALMQETTLGDMRM